MVFRNMFVRLIVIFMLIISVTGLLNDGLSFGKGNLKRRETLKSFLKDSDLVLGQERSRRQTQTQCFPLLDCNATFPYRFMNGTCNNLATNVHWGSTNFPFVRWLPSEYGAGCFTPRGTGFSPALPSARAVSAGMVSVINPPSLVADDITLMVMQWGQFLDHDLVFTPEENAMSCCNTTDVNCFNINVPTNDSFYGPFNVTCLPFVRSRPSPCVGGREQINERTAFLDASQVYGSSDAELDDLLLPASFLMAFGPGREVSSCSAINSSFSCRSFLPNGTSASGAQMFFAGDGRVEEQPGLTSIHTIFLRMHNDLATKIRNQNPNCSDFVVFLETRRILGAIMQRITYDEFLPIVVGPTMMNNFGLWLGTSGNYNSNLNPSAPNVFATAAFRFGHSLIKDAFALISTLVNLSESFNNHFITTMSNTFPSHFMRGISIDPSEPMDHILVDAVHNKLFAQAPFARGEDLYARNIQRGRDHGIPSYPNWITFTSSCFPRTVNSFDNLNASMPSEVVAKLRELYGTLDRVDLFPAAIAEHNVAGGLVGPTFACLISQYFRRLKFGDRFWFELDFSNNANQLNAIYNTRFSAIICRYTDATQLPRNVFLPINPTTNPLTNCNTLISNSVMDLIGLWSNIC